MLLEDDLSRRGFSEASARWRGSEIGVPNRADRLSKQENVPCAKVKRRPILPEFNPRLHHTDTSAIAQIGVQICLKHAIMPVRTRCGAALLVAARPDDVEMIQALLPHPWRTAPVRLGEEQDVQDRVAGLFRADLTENAATRVPSDESYRSTRGSSGQRLLLGGMLILIAVTAAVFAPRAVFTVLVFWACVTLLVAAIQKTAAAAAFVTMRRDAPEKMPAPEPGNLPSVSVLVPLFRERNVARVLVERLSKLQYPKDRLDVVLVLEETDSLTRRVLEMATLPDWMRIIVVPDGEPRTKPRAMNYALDFCRGEIIGIWDAEDAPAPDQINTVARRFYNAPQDMVCLQGVLDYYNPRQNWLARCFTIEYATWFRVMMPGMARLGFAIPLGGTTLFFRRDVLEKLGGWDAHNVTEDADLGFRLARHGYRTEMIETTTGEEANCHLWPWIKQRSRWLKGYMVTWAVHMRHPKELWQQMGPWKFLGMQTHFITALSQFLLAPLLWSFWLILLGLPHPLLQVLSSEWLYVLGIFFFGVEAISMIAALIALRIPSHRHLIPWLPAMHLYFPLGCIAAYKALWELLTAPCYWDKTSHGLSLEADGSPSAGVEFQPRYESL